MPPRSPVRVFVSIFSFVFAAAVPVFGADVSFKIADTKNAAVADAVVSLIPLDAPAKISPPAEPRVIAQQKQEFIPYVTAIAVGTTVAFPNQEEKIEHQVYSNSKPNQFELPLYKPGTNGTVHFDHPGVVVVGCNIHDWMLAYVVVVDTPWFAQTAAEGRAVIAQVSPGRYRAEVWHPRLAKVATREIVVGDAPAALDFALELGRDKRIRRSIATPGAGYK